MCFRVAQLWVKIMMSKYVAICTLSHTETMSTSSCSPLWSEIDFNSSSSALTLLEFRSSAYLTSTAWQICSWFNQQFASVNTKDLTNRLNWPFVCFQNCSEMTVFFLLFFFAFTTTPAVNTHLLFLLPLVWNFTWETPVGIWDQLGSRSNWKLITSGTRWLFFVLICATFHLWQRHSKFNEWNKFSLVQFSTKYKLRTSHSEIPLVSKLASSCCSQPSKGLTVCKHLWLMFCTRTITVIMRPF